LPHLALAFLGQFHVSLDDQPVTAFETDKVRALLAYLAVEADRAHARSTLVALLWPGYTEESARTTLRHVLHKLRQTIGDASASPPFLLITRQTLQFNPAAAHSLDVARFTALLQQCATHAHAQLHQCSLCLEQLRQAVELYRGDFLTSITIQDSAEFEEWRRIQQEQLHIGLLDALQLLANAHEANHDYAQARRYSQRQVELEPWHEAAHVQLMRVLARSGQRGAAIAQYHTCRQVLATELGVEPDAATTALYEQIRRGALADEAPAAGFAPGEYPSSAARNKAQKVTANGAQDGRDPSPILDPQTINDSPPHNLPETLTTFVGRERELAELSKRLQQPDVRLLTLVGPGGMGKTRLAVEAVRAQLNNPAVDLRSRFADGIFFVSLTPLTKATEIAPAIATAMNLPLRGDDAAQGLLDLLRSRRVLLLLDNCEHLLDGMSLIVALLQTAPHVQIIATSRERLNLQAEYLYGVEGLEIRAATQFAEVAQAAAVRLFVQSAQRVQPQFMVSEANVASVLKICALMQGMPLGLELAAAWTDTLTLDAIAAEIAQSADFLAADWRDVPARQRSMRAVFDWSWQLLNDVEREVLRRLTVFRGGFMRDAAQAVVGASLRVLTRLVHKSLLGWHQESGATMRYEVHELVRQFAAEQLEASPVERATVQEQHSVFYLAYVAERSRRLAYHEPRQAAAELRIEFNNIRQAWTWAVSNAKFAALEHCAEGFWLFFHLTGLPEGAELFGLAAERVRQSSTSAAAGDAQRLSLRLLSKLLGMQANLTSALGKFNQVIQLAQQVMAIDAAGEDSEAKIFATWVWGAALARKGELAEAQMRFEQVLQWAAVEQPKATGELLRTAEWLALVWLGAGYIDRDDYAAAKQVLHKALQICQSLGKVHGEATCLMNLGAVDLIAGNYAAVRQSYEQALPLIRTAGFRWGEGATLIELGQAVRMLGEYGLAATLLTQGQTVMYAIGELNQQGIALIALGELDICLGAYDRAQLRFDQYVQLMSSATSTALSDLDHTLALGTLAYHKGDFRQALIHATQGWQTACTLGNRTRQAKALMRMGHTHAGLQQPLEAAQAYAQALALYTELGKVAAAVEAKAGLAALALAAGEGVLAMQYVEEILPVLAEDPRGGVDEPFYTYLTCYMVLTTQQDARAATVLKTACTLLQTYADHIQDNDLRHSFLENVAVHRALHHADATVDLTLISA